MTTSLQSQAHARRLRVAYTFFAGLSAFLVFGLYKAAGAAPAVAGCVVVFILALFAVWLTKRTAAWRDANPSSDAQSVPFKAIGGFKALSIVVAITSLVSLLVIFLFNVLRI